MVMQKKLKHFLRIIAEIIFLAFFIMLLLLGRIQLWLVLFMGGMLFSFIFSRFYCGWICPMNTLFRPINRLYKKLKIKRIKMPIFLKHPVFRYIFLLLFLAAMIFTRKMDKIFPFLAIVTVLSVIVVLFFEEALWHNLVCPFGTILNLTSRTGLKNVKINKDTCIACGKCQKVCPSNSIDTLAAKKRYIRKSDCLVCHACENECPTNAIDYR